MSRSCSRSPSDHSLPVFAAKRFVAAGWVKYEAADATQKCLLLRMQFTTEESIQVYVGHLPTRWGAGLMPNERQARAGIAGEEPGIAVGAAVKRVHQAKPRGDFSLTAEDGLGTAILPPMVSGT